MNDPLKPIENVVFDFDKLAEDCEYHLQFIEPHYKIFLKNIKRGGLNNVRDFIRVFIEPVALYIDSGKIRDSILKSVENIDLETSHDVREMAQTIFRSNIVNINEELFSEYQLAVKRAGKASPKEITAFKMVNALIRKLFINQALLSFKKPVLQSYYKIFAEQYFTEYLELYGKNQIYSEAQKYVQGIQTPEFEKALKEHKDELKQNREFYYWSSSKEKLLASYKLLCERNLIKGNENFTESFRMKKVPSGFRTDWGGTQTELICFFYFVNGSKWEFNDSESGNNILPELFSWKGRELDNKNLQSKFGELFVKLQKPQQLNRRLLKIKEMVDFLELSK